MNLMYQKYKQTCKKSCRNWRLRHPEEIKQLWKQWYLKNKVHIKNYVSRRHRMDPKFRLNRNIRRNICESLHGGKMGRAWESLVGYNLEDLKEHLENQFDEKMSWDNYGSYWWIDHVKPMSLFIYKNAEDAEFIKCWSLGNLQPLEKTANQKKGNRIII